MATLTAYFLAKAVGLEVSFEDISLGNPTNWDWDFGTGLSGSTSVDQKPKYTYPEEGFFNVTLTITNVTSGEVSEIVQRIGVVNSLQECPQRPNLEAVYAKVPTPLHASITPSVIYASLRKWQRIIGKAVEPQIPDSILHDELHWPILPNELVIELVLLDLLGTVISKYLLALGGNAESSSSSSSKGGVKKVVTGPAEAEWYDASTSVADQVKAISGKGGLIEQSKEAACTLAHTLNVQLPICKYLPKVILAPTVLRPLK